MQLVSELTRWLVRQTALASSTAENEQTKVAWAETVAWTALVASAAIVAAAAVAPTSDNKDQLAFAYTVAAVACIRAASSATNRT